MSHHHLPLTGHVGGVVTSMTSKVWVFWVHSRELKHLTQGLPIRVQVLAFNLVNVSLLSSYVWF